MFLPYVYIVRNRVDKKFYIGMRSANKVVAEQDLGIHYFTSSKHVKNNFSDYDIEIKAYFIDQISAFEFENELIKQNWGDPLLLNRHYQKSMSKFSMTGAKRADLAEYNRKAKSKPKEERKYQCSNCQSDLTRIEFCHHSPKENYFCDAKCRNHYFIFQSKTKSSLCKPKLKKDFVIRPCERCKKLFEMISTSKSKFKCCSQSCRMKLVLKGGGHPAWNKGLENPQSAINGRNSAKKQSKTVTGRKRKYLADGTWTWEYPNK